MTKKKWGPGQLRPARALAAGKPCPYCGHPMDPESKQRRPSKDHVVPMAVRKKMRRPLPKGVPTIVVVCASCNNDKGHKLLDNWFRELESRRDPRAEHVAAFIRRRAEMLAEYRAALADSPTRVSPREPEVQPRQQPEQDGASP